MSSLRPLIRSQPGVGGALALAFALTVGTAWLGVVSTQGVLSASLRTGQTQDTLLVLHQLTTAVTDAETGQRGYLLTGDDSYLKPYDAAVSRTAPLMAALQLRLASHPARQEHLATLRALIEAKEAELARSIKLRREKSIAAALNLVETDRGQVLMEKIRAEFGQLETAELNDLRLEAERAAHQTEVFHYLSLCLIALAILFTGLASLLLARRIRDLSTIITVCAWTKRVKWRGTWVSFEEFLEQRFKLRFTHGISEEAARQFKMEAVELHERDQRGLPPPVAPTRPL
ncbi:MAG: CHASE3 domain-containing protein [Opitutaceae bacterium]|nr:CHASE3 domain-containing protein [Opitutaceae bacterium]